MVSLQAGPCGVNFDLLLFQERPSIHKDFKGAIKRYYEGAAILNELIDVDNYPPGMTDDDYRRAERERERYRINAQDLRARIVRDTSRATRIAGRVGAHVITISAPPPINAHLPIIHQNKFQAIFHDATYGQQVRPQHIIDCLDEMLDLLD